MQSGLITLSLLSIPLLFAIINICHCKLHEHHFNDDLHPSEHPGDDKKKSFHTSQARRLRWHTDDVDMVEKQTSSGRGRRAPPIICVNGTEVHGKCICQPLFVGIHCERQMFCSNFERTSNGSCVDCKPNYYGDRCTHMKCHNGHEDEFEQKCICDRPYTGQFCNSLRTADVYYYYNSRVMVLGPLGILSVIPMFLFYYFCERAAKRRHVKRIESSWRTNSQDADNYMTLDPERIKTLLQEKH